MNDCKIIRAGANARPPIAILGVPFDNVTRAEAIQRIEAMIASRKPHYLVTPNVDFLVQARRDIELRRILLEAHLVLCDGTPLVWVSRWLGNALPERVAGADLVPSLIQVAAQKKYRLFLLGATVESAEQAVRRLEQRYPGIVIAGHYSPPFNQLLEMDHQTIRNRILAAEPDLLFVSFGCPKQEKWVAMHYRSLGVPVTAGVGATIDFLAGKVARAPIWMQRSGTEWMFRLAQEPRRLFRRYLTDLWSFSMGIVPQWWELQARPQWNRQKTEAKPTVTAAGASKVEYSRVQMPRRLDFATACEKASLSDEIDRRARDCLLDIAPTEFVDSTGVGWLIRLKKRLRARGKQLVLVSPTRGVIRALGLMGLTDFFHTADGEEAARQLLRELAQTQAAPTHEGQPATLALRWRGEITAANADSVWIETRRFLTATGPDRRKMIDLSGVRFIDSTGIGLMVRAKKMSLQRAETLAFVGLQPPVRSVLRLSRVEEFLIGVYPCSIGVEQNKCESASLH